MRTFYKHLAIGVLGTLGAFGAMTASAQTDGSDYHPLQLNSPPNLDVAAGAIAAAHPTGTEATGQSTGAPAMNSQLTRDEVYRGAVAATHGTSTEAIGQSTGMAGITTGMAGVTGGQPH